MAIPKFRKFHGWLRNWAKVSGSKSESNKKIAPIEMLLSEKGSSCFYRSCPKHCQPRCHDYVQSESLFHHFWPHQIHCFTFSHWKLPTFQAAMLFSMRPNNPRNLASTLREELSNHTWTLKICIYIIYIITSMYTRCIDIYWLVVSTPLKIISQLASVGMIIPNIWKNEIHVPNHQLVYEISMIQLQLNVFSTTFLPPCHKCCCGMWVISWRGATVAGRGFATSLSQSQ